MMRHFFASAWSTSRRIASERFGKSGCFRRQASTFTTNSGGATSWILAAGFLSMSGQITRMTGRVKCCGYTLRMLHTMHTVGAPT